MDEETGPCYDVPLIKTLPLGNSGMLQAMPTRADLIQTRKKNERVAEGYEVLLSHYMKLKSDLERMQLPHR